MVADSLPELHAFAESLGLKRAQNMSPNEFYRAIFPASANETKEIAGLPLQKKKPKRSRLADLQMTLLSEVDYATD